MFFDEKGGLDRIIDGSGAILPQAFLDIDARVNSQASERGLLGLTLHPNYADNGYFYVNYTNSSGNTRISRFSARADDPNQADPNSELILLEVNQAATSTSARTATCISAWATAARPMTLATGRRTG